MMIIMERRRYLIPNLYWTVPKNAGIQKIALAFILIANVKKTAAKMLEFKQEIQ